MVLLTFATYGIGERLAGPRLGALAALVVATSHGTFIFAREYIFALPTAALLACAMYALLRSERLEIRRWAIACGAALGLMVLARTMACGLRPRSARRRSPPLPYAEDQLQFERERSTLLSSSVPALSSPQSGTGGIYSPCWTT